MIQSSALSIFQFIKSPVPGGSFILSYECVLTLLAWQWTQACCRPLPHVSVLHWMHFDCIFMWQECKIKDEWITQHIQTNKHIWKMYKYCNMRKTVKVSGTTFWLWINTANIKWWSGCSSLSLGRYTEYSFFLFIYLFIYFYVPLKY